MRKPEDLWLLAGRVALYGAAAIVIGTVVFVFVVWTL